MDECIYGRKEQKERMNGSTEERQDEWRDGWMMKEGKIEWMEGEKGGRKEEKTACMAEIFFGNKSELS